MSKKSRHRIENQSAATVTRVENGLGEALGPGTGGFNGIAHGLPGFGFGGAQISQTTTLFKSLRNYLISNHRQLLSQAYVEIGLFATVVDVPVDDAFKGGITVKTKALDEKDLVMLHTTMEREGDISETAQAEKWKRLYGGGAIIIITDQDPETPLDLDAIDENTPLEFRAADCWELFSNRTFSDDDDEETAAQLELDEDDNRCYTYYGVQVHESRVIKMPGKRAPSFLRGRVRGWGLSACEPLVRTINQYLKATDLTFEVLDEFKLDIYKFKGLASTLAGVNGDMKVKQRVATANGSKNYNEAIVLDAEDDYDHKQLTFTGIAEVMTGVRMQAASDLRMPITKLFGISATGFNSGEDDIEVYNSMIEGQIRSTLKYNMIRVVEIRCQKLFGFIPDDLSIEFKPLRVLSAEQEENIKDKKYTRVSGAKAAGEITTLEYRDAVNRGNLFDIQLDTSDEELLGPDADTLVKPDPIQESAEGGDDDTEEGGDGSNVLKGNFGSKSKKLSNSKKAMLRRDTIRALKREVGLGMQNDLGYQQSISTGSHVMQKTVGAKYAAVTVMPKRFTEKELKKRKIKNSTAFDLASYEADGGDSWIDPGRKGFFIKPTGVDQSLWDESIRRTREVFGTDTRWQFTVWLYRKLGGRFK